MNLFEIKTFELEIATFSEYNLDFGDSDESTEAEEMIPQ